MFLSSAALLGGCAVGGRETVKVSAVTSNWNDAGLTGRRITTAHFEIISTLQDSTLEAALPGFLEAAYRRYEKTLPVEGGHERLITYVFATRSQWSRFVAEHYPTRFDIYRRIQTGGFTEGRTSVSFHMGRASTLATLAHEGWHQYVDARCPGPIPAWLNEGLACYHEAVEFVGPSPRFTPTRNTFRRNSLREALQQKRALPLRDLLATDAGQMVGRHPAELAQAYYAQTWALVTFLRHGPDNRLRDAFEQLLVDVAAGRFNTQVRAARLTQPQLASAPPGVAAFRTYFSVAPESLEHAFDRHLLRQAGFAAPQASR